MRVYTELESQILEELCCNLNDQMVGFRSERNQEERDEIQDEILIVKDPSLVDNSQYASKLIIPKYLRGYRYNTCLMNVRSSLCTLEIHYSCYIKENLQTVDKIRYATGFLVAPYSTDKKNYLMSCAHCFKNYSSSEEVTSLKTIIGSFNETKDILKRQEYCFECEIEAMGDYETISESGVSEDWAILSFVDYVEHGSPNYLIPSPSQVLAFDPENLETIPDNYSCYVFGLSIPNSSSDSNIGHCKETGLLNEQILRLIPDTQFSMSLGWFRGERVSDFSIPHCANTCLSNSGSPLLTCNIPVSAVMILPVNDHLQKSQIARDFIKSQTFNNKVIGIHCSHNQEMNYACSILKWFLPYYQIVFSQIKDRFTEEEIGIIENEYLEYNKFCNK